MLMRWLRRWWQRWQRARLLRRHRIPLRLWSRAVTVLPLLQRYPRADRHRLRVLASEFLQQKTINGAGGLEPDPWMHTVIAAQACVPILELGLSWYQGWREIVLYPDSFFVHEQWQDEYGVVHEDDAWRSGEAWEHGPLILAWSEIDPAGIADNQPGLNVVVHEFAHKLDALNGFADGYPPLHAEMDHQRWTRIFEQAFHQLAGEIELEHEVLIDPYAATNPAEFFAVISEYFFCSPAQLNTFQPQLYQLMCQFYRQHPLVQL